MALVTMFVVLSTSQEIMCGDVHGHIAGQDKRSHLVALDLCAQLWDQEEALLR